MYYEINLNPTKKHLSQIKQWLIDELNKTGGGFYKNWNIIEKSFNKNKMILITENDLAIGFLIYRIDATIINIDIAVISPKHRNKGLGRKLIEESLSKFKKHKLMVCELFCSPENSAIFWKNLNFKKFPSFSNDSKLRMYKTLIPELEISKPNETNEKIELWNMEPHLAKRNKPMWSWNMKFIENSRKLTKPIIHPAKYNWQLKWSKENETKFKNKVNRFNFKEIKFEDFIIIKELP